MIVIRLRNRQQDRFAVRVSYIRIASDTIAGDYRISCQVRIVDIKDLFAGIIRWEGKPEEPAFTNTRRPIRNVKKRLRELRFAL